MLRDLIGKILNKTKKVVSAARTSSGEFLLKKTDFGLIHVEFAAVEKIAQRALLEVKEINEAELVVEKSANNVTPMRIRLTAILSEGFSAPRASQAAYSAINKNLRDLLGLEFYVPVEVKVKQIAQSLPKKQRVR